MPAKDRHHDIVKRALTVEGWRIADENAPFFSGSRTVYVDLEVENTAQRLLIFVEVKGFHRESQVTDLADALGQYLLYRHVIDDAFAEHVPLYLAVPNAAYLGILSEPLGLAIRQKYALKLLVIDLVQERIVQWLS